MFIDRGIEYLRGIGKPDDNDCAQLFKDYQTCLNVRGFPGGDDRSDRSVKAQKLTNSIKVALKQRGIDKLLEDAREDNKENDATYLGRKCKWTYHMSKV